MAKYHEQLKEHLKQFLQQPYDGADAFLENVIYPVFGSDNFENYGNLNVLAKRPDLRPKAEATGINEIRHIGGLYVEGSQLDIFDITLDFKKQLQRNRVEVQQIVRSIISSYSGAFIIFHYGSGARWEWRFTFFHKGASAGDSTDAKRYTFLLGPGQSCRTAAENFTKIFEKIDNEGEFEMDDIVRAFDVEALSKEFFGKYKAQYEKFCQFVYDHKTEREWFGPEFEQWEDKRIRDYVKRMLGRIVFLHFLQKKGWMGVPADKEWGEGDMQFMKDLFDQATPAQQANYLDEVLEPMFIDLDTLRDNDIAGAWCNHLLPYGGRQGGGLKVPYLNGGLFEKDEMDEPKSVFPAEYFRDLFTFFYQYNFTIDENDPDDAQVGVDPEMLGRIFENLLEDNKDKGAFYTPKEIVQYMCRESLIAYLQTDLTDEATREALRMFVTSYDAAVLGGASSALAAQVSEQLKAVKICDPAIGSGAFPMGLLRELFLCRSAIEGFERKQSADIKRHIIQQNIYGVDIEKGAVDIARLRFWLTLILDEETPHALPNLDFKIMQGNSLLEQYQGIDLTLVSKTKNERRKHKLGDMQLTWFEADIDVTRRQLKEMMKEYYSCENHARRSTLRDAMAANVKSQIQSLNGALDLSNINVAANSDFFLWHTWFADVFEEGGFDIVIGNPPYVNVANIKDENIRNLYRKQYVTAKNKCDLYSFFTEQAYYLAKSSGICSYIFSNSWMGTDSFSLFRKFLVEKTSIQKLVNLPDKVFENATVKTCIICFSKKESPSNTIKLFNYDGKKFTPIDHSIKYDDIRKFDNYPISFEKGICLAKIKTVLLKDIAEFSLGIKTSNDKRFIGDSSIDDSSYKLLRGRNLTAYCKPFNNEWIWYRPDLFAEKIGARPRVLSHFLVKEKIVLQDIATEIVATIDCEQYLCNDTINIIHQLNEAWSMKFLLGLLNSRLIRFWHKKVFPSGLHIKISQLKEIPVPHIAPSQQLPIITLVDEILSAKKANPQADTSALESEIDRLVYDLYGLTEEEIAIVEGQK